MFGKHINKLCDHSKITIVLILTISCFYVTTHQRYKENINETISGDGRGYYAYLTAVFIDHDFSYNSALSYDRALKVDPPGNFLVAIDGKQVNKYFGGLAILLLPFFLLAYFFSWIFGFELNGYSPLFHYGVSTAALFYFAAGLNFLRKFLLLEGYSQKNTSLSLIFISLASNLFLFACWDQSYTHVYSFSAICMFLYYAKLFFIKNENKHFILMIIAFAIVVGIRPVNGIVLAALPFLAGDIKIFLSGILEIIKKPVIILFSFVILLVPLFIQGLSYYFQTGNFFLYSYGEESFNFLHPEIINVLFSYKKGLFIYTPITFIALLSLPFLFKKDFFRFCALTIFLFIVMYAIASWWNWWYGYSFGSRAFVDFYPFFTWLLVFLFSSVNRYWKIVLISICSFLIYLNFVQTYQYLHYILHGTEMTKERYWKIFLKTGKKYDGIFFRQESAIVASAIKPLTLFYDFEHADYKLGQNGIITQEKSYSGKFSSKVDNQYKFSATIVKRISDLPCQKIGLIKLSAWIWLQGEKSDAQLVISFETKEGEINHWHAFKFSGLIKENEKWEFSQFELAMPPVNSQNDFMKLYVWTPKGNTAYVDDIKIDFY